MTDGWVVIPNWDKFQHYKNRGPVWIKLYTELRDRDEWRHLTLAARGLLASIWIEYAARDTQLRSSDVPSVIGQKVPRRSWDSLLDAGLIEVSASKPLAKRYPQSLLETETEKDPPLIPPPSGGIKPPSKKQLQKLTGCRWVRGSHGGRHIPDPLGTDPPPKDWPYGRPSRREVELAMEAEL